MKKIVFLFVCNLIITSPVVAEESLRDRFGGVTDEPTGRGVEAFAQFIENIYNFAFGLAIVCSAFLLTYGAYKMITSAGDPERLMEAREIVTNAILGVLMIGLGIGILHLLATMLGVPVN